MLHRALAGPRDGAEAHNLLKAGCFPEMLITRYLERYRARFDLFDEKTPFYQVADFDLPSAKLAPITRLESMAGDSNFQRALAGRRCVVLARSVVLREGREKVVRRAAGELLRLAGVFEHNATGVRDYRSFALVCRTVQSDATVHPASLNAAGVALWLSSTPGLPRQTGRTQISGKRP